LGNDIKFVVLGDVRDLENKLSKSKKSFDSLARNAKVAFLASAAALAAPAIAVGKFEAGLSDVLTLLDKDKIKEFGGDLSKASKEAIKLGFSIDDSNKALFDTVSAIGDINKSLDIFTIAQKLAIGGTTSLSIAVDGLTSIVNAYGKEVTNATKVSNAFFSAQRAGKTTVAELALNIGKLAPIAKQAGVGFEEMLAAVSQLTLGGLSTEEAVIGLRQAISALIKPGQEAISVLKKFNVPIGATEVRAKGLTFSLQKLAEAAKENPDALAKMIPNIRALTAISSLGSSQIENLSRIVRDINSDFENGTGLSEAYELKMKDLKVVFGQLTGGVKVLLIELGEKLAPTFARLSTSITNLTNFISENKPLVNLTANALLAITALSGLAFVVGTLGKAYIAMSLAAAALGAQLVFLSSVQMFGLNTSILVLIANVGWLYPALLIIGTAAAAAFVGWKLGELIRDLPIVSKFLDDIGKKLGELEARATLGAGYISEEDFNRQREEEGWQARADARAKDLEDQRIALEQEAILRAEGLENQRAVHDAETILKDEKLIREEEFFAKLRELSLIDLSTMQQDMQLQVNLLESFEKRKTGIIKQEIQARKALVEADKNVQLAALDFVSQMTQAFGKESRAVFFILKAVRIAEILVNSAAAAMNIAAAWAWNPPVEAALLAKNKFLTILSLATVAATTIAGFEVGAANIPRDQIAQVHAGEMVVTEPIAESIRSGDLSLSGGGSGGGIVFDFSNTTFNGVTESFVQDIFTKASESINNRTLSPLPAV